jgi:hypothetical protein
VMALGIDRHASARMVFPVGIAEQLIGFLF